MNILVLNYEFPPIGGGASSASFYSARELVRLGHEVDFLTCQATKKKEFEVIAGINIHRVPSFRRADHNAGLIAAISFVWFARSRLRRLLAVKKYDIGHFYFAVPTGILTFTWRKLTNAPYVVSLRGSDVPGYDPNARLINFIHKLLLPMTRQILHNSFATVANSKSLRKLALQSFPDQQISTITNGVCVKEFAPKSHRKSDGYHLKALCVARLVPRKGIEYLLGALSRKRPAGLRVLVVGSGPLETKLKTLSNKLQLNECVEFIGGLGDELLIPLYEQADFYIHPTLTESFSMALLEAMSCGLPVVASNVGGIPELITDGINGYLVEPENELALADAINRMSNSAADRERFSRANRNKIIESYSWETIVEQYLTRCFARSEHGAGLPG